MLRELEQKRGNQNKNLLPVFCESIYQMMSVSVAQRRKFKDPYLYFHATLQRWLVMLPYQSAICNLLTVDPCLWSVSCPSHGTVWNLCSVQVYIHNGESWLSARSRLLSWSRGLFPLWEAGASIQFTLNGTMASNECQSMYVPAAIHCIVRITFLPLKGPIHFFLNCRPSVRSSLMYTVTWAKTRRVNQVLLSTSIISIIYQR